MFADSGGAKRDDKREDGHKERGSCDTRVIDDLNFWFALSDDDSAVANEVHTPYGNATHGYA